MGWRKLRHAILERGVHDDLDDALKMRVRLSNRVALSDAITALIAGPILGWLAGQAMIGVMVTLLFVPNLAPLWLNARGAYRLSRSVSILGTCLWMAGISYLLGPQSHAEVGLIATAAGAQVLLPQDEPGRGILALSPLAAMVLIALLRFAFPFPGVVAPQHQTAVFVFLMYATMAAVIDRVLILIGEERRRQAALTAARDEAQRAREEAEGANEAKSVFLAHMSHELRTPLAGVIGLTDLVLGTRLDAEQRGMLEQSQQSARHLMSVLSGVLDLTKIEAGALEAESQGFNLELTVRSAVAMMATPAQAKGLDVEVHIALDQGSWRRGDALRVKQVLVNLLSNAVKFTEQGRISLDVWSEGSETVHFEVTDTGIGMDAERIERVFESFQQGDLSTARRYGGTGLGLAISRQLVVIMGGELECHSTPGQGSSFRVRLPLPMGTPMPVERLSVPSRRGLSVLVAEDNPANQVVIRLMLERLGHRVTVVEDGKQAIDRGLVQNWDLILMDLQMPNVDGIQAATELRRQGYAGPICALTANAMQQDVQRCLDAGMDEVLFKPVDTGRLADMLARWCPAEPAAARG